MVFMNMCTCQLKTEANRQPTALEVYNGRVLWADASDATIRACAAPPTHKYDKQDPDDHCNTIIRNHTGNFDSSI